MNNAFVIIDGNLTKDPTLKQVGRKNVCNFTVAVNVNGKNEDGTNRANFYDCSAWDTAGEYAFSKLKKGTEVTVRGHLEMVSRTVDDQTFSRLRIDCDHLKIRRNARDDSEHEVVTEAPVETMDDSE